MPPQLVEVDHPGVDVEAEALQFLSDHSLGRGLFAPVAGGGDEPTDELHHALVVDAVQNPPLGLVHGIKEYHSLDMGFEALSLDSWEEHGHHLPVLGVVVPELVDQLRLLLTADDVQEKQYDRGQEQRVPSRQQRRDPYVSQEPAEVLRMPHVGVHTGLDDGHRPMGLGDPETQLHDAGHAEIDSGGE